MSARKIKCEVLEKTWLTPTSFVLKFQPSRSFRFEAGQFISVLVPSQGARKVLRRCYSLASPYGSGYELCIKEVEGGAGSGYLAGLKACDQFDAYAPYGKFLYHPVPEKNACFISTGTGIAPLKAMMMSEDFQDHPPAKAFSIFGARHEKEILYPAFFESYGVESLEALSQPSPHWKGFRGRVTDYLKSLPLDWYWRSTEFYICGNGDMVQEVKRILREGRGVPAASIHSESYFLQQRLGVA